MNPQIEYLKISKETVLPILHSISGLCDDDTVRLQLNKAHELRLTQSDSTYLFEIIYQLVVAHYFCRTNIEKVEDSKRQLRKLANDLDAISAQFACLKELSRGLLGLKGLSDFCVNSDSFQREAERARTAAKLLLADHDDNLQNFTVRKGRKKKAKSDMWFHLASVYQKGGGKKVSAFYDPVKGVIDSPFIAFCRTVLELMPVDVSRYYSSRMGESIRDWRRRRPRPSQFAQGIFFRRPHSNTALCSMPFKVTLNSASQSQEMPWIGNTHRKPKLPAA